MEEQSSVNPFSLIVVARGGGGGGGGVGRAEIIRAVVVSGKDLWKDRA